MRDSNVGNPASAAGVDAAYVDSATRAAAVLLQGKWKVEILCALRSGPIRIGRLSRLIPTASKKMLTHNLRRLEADGIITRRDLSGMVLHVEYDFDHRARTEVCALIDHLTEWGRAYTPILESIPEPDLKSLKAREGNHERPPDR